MAAWVGSASSISRLLLQSSPLRPHRSLMHGTRSVATKKSEELADTSSFQACIYSSRRYTARIHQYTSTLDPPRPPESRASAQSATSHRACDTDAQKRSTCAALLPTIGTTPLAAAHEPPTTPSARPLNLKVVRGEPPACTSRCESSAANAKRSGVAREHALGRRSAAAGGAEGPRARAARACGLARRRALRHRARRLGEGASRAARTARRRPVRARTHARRGPHVESASLVGWLVRLRAGTGWGRVGPSATAPFSSARVLPASFARAPCRGLGGSSLQVWACVGCSGACGRRHCRRSRGARQLHARRRHWPASEPVVSRSPTQGLSAAVSAAGRALGSCVRTVLALP